MVEDNQIKTEVSPFAIREGEIKVFDGKDGYVSMNQIIHKINIGHITDIHFKVMELVNEFEFITSRQIYQMQLLFLNKLLLLDYLLNVFLSFLLVLYYL